MGLKDRVGNAFFHSKLHLKKRVLHSEKAVVARGSWRLHRTSFPYITISLLTYYVRPWNPSYYICYHTVLSVVLYQLVKFILYRSKVRPFCLRSLSSPVWENGGLGMKRPLALRYSIRYLLLTALL